MAGAPQKPPSSKPSSKSLLRSADYGSVKTALDLHARYLSGQAGGRRANFSYLDMSNFALERVDLSYADLSGARLAGAFMSEAVLEHAVLFGADLRDADLRRARMSRADIRGACLRGANLAGADLADCDLREGVIAVQDLSKGFWILRHDEKPGELDYAVAKGANLRGVQNSDGLAVATDLSDAVLAGARLVRAKLTGAVLDGADLSQADVMQADLAGASLKRAVIAGVDLDGANFEGADLEGALKAPQALVYIDDTPLHDVISDHELWCDSEGFKGKPARLAAADFRPVRGLDRRRLALEALGVAPELVVGDHVVQRRVVDVDQRQRRPERPLQVRAFEVGAVHVHAGDHRPLHRRAGKIGLHDVGLAEVRAIEHCAGQLGAHQPRTGQDRIGEVRGHGQAVAVLDSPEVGALGDGVVELAGLLVMAQDPEAFGEVLNGDHALAQVAVRQIRAGQIGAAQAGAADVSPGEARPSQVRVAQVRAEQHRVLQHRLAHEGAGQPGAGQVRVAQVHAFQGEVGQVQMAEVGAPPTRLAAEIAGMQVERGLDRAIVSRAQQALGGQLGRGGLLGCAGHSQAWRGAV